MDAKSRKAPAWVPVDLTRNSCRRLTRTIPKELAEFRRIVESRGAAMRGWSRDDILIAGGQPTEHIQVDGRPATLSVIVESKDDGSLRVVVQGFMKSRLLPFVSSVALDGFYLRPTGAVEPMPDDEFHEFD